MIHADPPIEHAHASSGPRRVRLRASWVALALLGAVLVAALVAVRLAVQHARVQRADVPTFISRGLGSATAAAPVRMPARGVRVRLDVRGYRVDAGRATVSVAALHAGHAAWSQRAHGVTRATPFGYESIVVGPQRTEELLTVRKHEGKRLWRWRIDAPARPVLGRDGSVAFARGGGMTGMRIAPVQILDADGGSITPRSARWRVRRAHAGSWWLELRLDDSKLSTPYVIDPATDYPSPLYLSSTASTDAGSWRLVTAAPAAANVATSNTPGANATGYFAFRPGSATTTATTPSATPTGNGFVQDLAGGTAFAAGSWTFAVKTQIPSTGIVAGSAILSIGVWKGTISKQGNFSATQTILSPTDDPAAQNIRAALTQTTNVTYSLPAFVLSSTERLYVEIWRRQTGGINSATAADRQLQLVVNDGVSRITHPAADDTPPTNSFSVVNPTGGVYFTNPGGASGTVFVRGSAVGSFQLHDAAADTGSGVKQVTYPALSTGGWTHAAQTVTTAPAYQSSTYSWAVGANSPGGQAILATDNAGNASAGTPLTLTNDSTAPTTPSATLTGSPAWTRTPSVDLTLTDGTDAGSGLDPAARVIQRDETALVNGVCGTFPSTWNVAVSDPDTTVVNGKCYRYRVVEADRVGNQATSTPSATAKVDLQAPTQPALGVGSLTNASATNSTVYYRPGVSGSFAISANSTDAESGVASYAFPTPATWTVTGTGANRTYAWSGTPTPPGTLGVHATDGAGNTSLDATFTPTPDSAAPTTTDDAASIGTAWNAAAQTVTLTPSDPLSGVSATYYTTNGSTPTTGSPQGTSISLTADGTYTIKYFSVDKVGNLEPVKTAGATIRVDGTPPSVTLASLPAAIRNGQVLTASASDPTSGVASLTYLYCNPSPCTPTTVLGTSTTGPGYAVTWSAEPADGSYDVAVRAMDNAGNVVTSAKQTVVIDNTTPDTSITSHPSAISTDGRPTFSFTATEPGVTFQCKVDAGAFAACTSPSTFTLADGAHTIAVRAADAAGNVDATPDSFAWTIDTTAPTTTITSRPAAIVNDSTASFSFTANDSAATFECKLDGGSFAACTSPTSYTGLAEGSHTFTVRSIDSAGNADPSPKVASWSIDTNAPDTTITAHPASVSTSAGATFSVTSSEPGSTFECALDGGAFAACSSPITYPNLADGDHTFAVHAIDGAGNTDPSPDTFSWTIDSLAPDTSIISHPNDPSNDDAPSFAFTSTEPGATYRCKLDGGSFSACTSPQAYTSLSDGAHTFAVQASDPAGNVDASPATFGWSIDTVVPDISITSQPANPSNDWAPTFAFSSAKTTATFECKLDDAAFSSCASPYGFAELPDGEHTFAVHAEDAAGNTSDDAAYTWTLDTTGVSAAADEIHYTFESATSVAFDWRGSPIDIRYGLTKSYGSTAIAHAPDIMPFSSPGPFREVELAGLQPGATYHYSIGGSRDHTFTTAPTDTFRFDVIADVGSSFISSRMAEVQNQVAADLPSFVLLPGDLTYGNVNGQAAVDQHFNDVMAWSLTAAYMPAWGNHEYETPATDDLRNYKGRFKLPNAQGIPSAPAQGCCGEDWGWFDAGGVRFIAYPERYRTSSMSEWQSAVDPIFAQAQADPNIHFIVTFGHEPPYSTGFHPGVQDVANVLGSFGDRYPKYVLNLNGHSHDYERYVPIHGVTNITSGGATTLEPPWTSSDPKQAFRAMHIEHLRVDVGSDGIRIEAICGPATQQDDTTCAEGSVLDSYTIGTPAPPPALAPVLYVDNNNPVCSDTGLGTQDEPFCKISTAASRVNPGQTIEVASGIYPETVTVPTSATEAAPIRFRTAPGASVLVTGGANGFTISNKSWISVNGFSISNTAGPGISVQNSSDITITNNHVIDAGEPVSGHAKSGIFLNTVRDSIVSGNTTDHNSSYGIYLAGSTRNDISHNTTFSNAQEFQRAAAGIRLYSSTQNTVERNITHDNEDSGIESFTNSNDNLIVNNVSYNNGDHGIDNYGSTGQRLIGNTVYHNFTAGINVEGGSTGATVANNVSVDNGIGSPRTRSDIRVENGSTAGTTLDYDLAYLTTPDVLFVWSSVPYNTLASFRAASGQEAHGINADPKFVDLANYNFHLTSRSPAVDSANSGASGEPGADSVGTGRVDDPATVDTGIGPRPYDDRGALELPSAPLDHITATPSAPSVAAGSSLRIDVTGFDAIGGSFGDVSGSSTYDIAPDGSCTQNVCTATKSGPHAVTATDGEKTSVASFTVTPASLDHIDLTPAVATTTALAPQAYTAVGRDVYGNSLGDITSTVTLSIAPNGSCSGASCTAPLAGAHTVTATKSAKTGTATLQVTASALDHIVIAPSSASIAAGATQPYTAQGFDAAGNSLGDVTAGTTFSIGPDGSCTGNVCTAAVARAHTVTGNDGGKTSTSALSVTAGPLDHLALTPPTATIAAGASRSYTVDGRDRYDNSLGNVTSSTTFSIAPDGSCTGAVCTATSTGPHTVTATDAGKTGTAALSVVAAALDHLVVSPASTSLATGATQPYTAEGRDVYGNSLGDLTSSTTFMIAPDGSCLGSQCSAAAVGSHVITATAAGASGTAALDAHAPTRIDHIVISPGGSTIDAGESQAYSVEGFDADGNSLGDVTTSTSFSIGPDGSCLGNTCTATPAWPHVVTANTDGQTDSAALFVTPGALDHLQFTPDATSITAGGSITFEADARDRFENSLGDVTSGTTFAVDGGGECAAETCTVTAAGSHSVTGAFAGKQGTASVEVTPAGLDHLVLVPSSSVVIPGGSTTYAAQGRDAFGNSLGDATGQTTFTIAPDGSCSGTVCTPASSGDHTVTGTFGAATGTASLRVLNGSVDRIAISPSDATITAGDTQTYTAEAFDSSGASLGDITANTHFSLTPDGSCATSDCAATAVGVHTVTAQAAGLTVSTTLRVVPAGLDHVLVAPSSATIAAGDAKTFTAEGRDVYDNSLGDVTNATSFSIVPNGSCTGATCTASVVGGHTVTGNDAGKTGTASLQVTGGAIDHIVLSPAATTLTAGGSQTYSVQAFDAAGNSLGDVTGSTTLSLSPDGSCTGGRCTVNTAGAHTLTATDGGKTATASISVNAGPLDHLALSPASATVAGGATQAYTVEGRDQYDNPLGDMTASATFSISPDGSCTANGCQSSVAGTHTVTATRSGKTGTATLRVTSGALDHIVVSPSPATTTAGVAQTYTAEGFDAANNSVGDVTTHTSFAIIPDGSCTANVCTATVAGTHTITGTDAGKTSSATLTVVAGALDHLALSPASATIAAGGSRTYTAQGRDRYDNSLGDATPSTTFLIWPDGTCSGTTCTASVSGAHTVTGTLLGTSGTASLQVNAGPLDHIALTPATAKIAVGSSQAFTAQGFDASNNSLGSVTSATAFSISPDGSCSGSLCTPASGGRHTVTGADGTKTSTASLDVDFVKNAGFETDASGWNISGSGTGVTLARSAGGHTGSWSGVLTNGSTQNQTCVLNDSPDWGKPVSPGTTYRGSIWVRADRTGAPLKLRFREYSSSGVLLGTATSQVTLSGTWQQVTVSYTATAAGSSLDFNAYLLTADAPNGNCFYADDASVAAAPPPGAVDHIVVTPASATITAGATQAFSAEGFDANGTDLGDVTAATTFSIAPNGSCTGNGCTATAAGGHTVTATDAGKTATAAVTVLAGALDHLVVTPATASVAAGTSQTFAVEGRDQYDNTLGDVTSTSTLTIAPNGSCSGAACTATAAGPHTVTATKTAKTGTATLTITAGPLDHLALTPASATIAAGGSQAYTADGRDQYNNSLGDVTSTTTFSIAPDGSCSGAACTATKAGAHTITGTKAGKTGTASLSVTAAPLDHLVLSPATGTIAAGGSAAFTADGRDQYENSLGDVTATTTFTIAPNGSCTAASCTATAAGVHTITGTKGGKTGTASLTVAAGPLDHLVLSPSASSISAGGSRTYTVEGRDQYDNSRGDVTAASSLAIAPNGSCTGATCTATNAGAHTVTATDASKTGTASLAVTPGALDHIVLSPATASITSGGSQSYTAEGRDQYENVLGDVTAGTTFSIAPDGSCSGATCSATKAGPHTVTGTNGGKSGTASLTVSASTVLDHIVVSPASATIASGGSQSYTAQGFDAGGNSLGDVTAGTSFSIAPDGSCSGNVCSATGGGNHTITATNSGVSSTASLTVDAGAHLVITPATATISAGGSQTFTAQSYDSANHLIADVTSSTTFTISPDGSCTTNACTTTVAGQHLVSGTSAGMSGSASLTVNAGPLDHLALSPTPATISSGGSQSYTAEGRDQYENVLGDVTAGTTFSIAPDGSCSGATCSATKAGPHTVTGTNGGKSGTASLTVSASTVLDHIVVSPASATIASGGSQSYTAQGFDAGGNSLGDVTAGTSFSIAPDGSCSGNVCSATAVGTHTVTATDNGKTATSTLNVTAGALDHMVISPTLSTVNPGVSQAYTTQGFDASNNSLGDITSLTTFTIAPDGSCLGNVCTATVPGPHTVTATDSGKTATATLRVSYVKNSSFETDLTGWNTSGSGTGVTLTRVSGGHVDNWAALLTNTASTNQSCLLNDSPDWAKPTVAGTYTGTLWVRADRAGAPLKLRFREYNASSTLVGTSQSQVTLSTAWQQISVAYTITAPGGTLDLNAFLSSADSPPGTCFYADEAVITRS